MSSILAIQSKLKCSKSHKNNFGNYNYRKCEDILEALKPLLLSQGVTMTISDQCLVMEGQLVIQSTVRCHDGDQQHEVSGFAGVEKAGGMSLSQSFGAASSYARKYALNGMFLIDDSVDDDHLPPSKVSKTSSPATSKSKVSSSSSPATNKVTNHPMPAISKAEQLKATIHYLNMCDPQDWKKLIPFKEGVHKDKSLLQLTKTDEGVKLITYLSKQTDRQTNPRAGYILDSAINTTKI